MPERISGPRPKRGGRPGIMDAIRNPGAVAAEAAMEPGAAAAHRNDRREAQSWTRRQIEQLTANMTPAQKTALAVAILSASAAGALTFGWAGALIAVNNAATDWATDWLLKIIAAVATVPILVGAVALLVGAKLLTDSDEQEAQADGGAG